MIRSLYLSLIYFFLISCNQNNDLKDNVLLSNEITFDVFVNDYKLIDSDSLQVKLSFINTDSSKVVLDWSTNDILNGQFDLGRDSLNTHIKNIPVSQGADSVFIDIKQNDISINSFSIKVEPRNEQKVVIVSDSESNFSGLLNENRLFTYNLIKTESFKKYDFSGYDILIVESVKEFSDNLIREIQKFMLRKKTILYFMGNVNTAYLSQTLDYPTIKAIRGSSKNQFFKLDSEYPNKYLSSNSKEFKIFRFFELKNYKSDEAFFKISTNDPIVIKKNIFGSNVFFLATKMDDDWNNELFNEFIYDIFLDLVYSKIVVNES